jgi:hypothetical protein
MDITDEKNLITFWPLEADGDMPDPGEVVLILLAVKPAGIKASISTDHTPIESPTVVPAVLRFVKDGFGRRHPSQWRVIGLNSERDDPSGYATQIQVGIDLDRVLGWARVRVTTLPWANVVAAPAAPSSESEEEEVPF